jgi:Coenzyme PQQ synthesis protein D (PqqD)
LEAILHFAATGSGVNPAMTHQICEDVVWIESDGGVRLYNGLASEFLTLDSTAAEIWLLLAQGVATQEIVATLANKYADGHAKVAQRISIDIGNFLASLTTQGILCQR